MGERGQPGDSASGWGGGGQGEEPCTQRPWEGFNSGRVMQTQGDQGPGQHRPSLLLSRKNCPVSGLLWVCPGHKPAAGFSQDRVCHFSALSASLRDECQGKKTRGSKPRKVSDVSSHREANGREARERPPTFSCWEVLLICV